MSLPTDVLTRARIAFADGDLQTFYRCVNEVLGIVSIGGDPVLNLLTYSVLDGMTRAEAAEHARIRAEAGPVGLFLHLHDNLNRVGHGHRSYAEWRYRRIMKILTQFGTDWAGRRVVEIGGGQGDIGAFFAQLGAEVLSLEGRPENVCVANLRHRQFPGFKSVVLDLEKDAVSALGRFDIAINFGFLEVVTDQTTVLAKTAELADDIFLETVVADCQESSTVLFDYGALTAGDEILNDRPLGTMTARIPSPAFVEEFFTGQGYGVTRLFDRDLNTPDHLYDWLPTGSGDVSMFPCRRRFWRFGR